MTVLRRSQLALRRAYGTTTKKQSNTKLTVGIRREDPLRIWERRCPLTPDAVHELVHKDGVEVLVQPCERRVWRMSEMIEVPYPSHSSCSQHIYAYMRMHDVILGRCTSAPDATPRPYHLGHQGDPA